jgi:pyruvate formate lyase activating enzyme
MEPPVEARFYEKIGRNRVRCALCAHRCLIEEGRRGLCAVRENRGGILFSLVYGRVVSRDRDPIEKKPLFHFLPGSCAYSVATVGCNFTCGNCQNHYISQYPREHGGRILGDDVTPAELVAGAVESGCESIAYTYTEPTVYLEYALDAAHLAKEEGRANVLVTNGYMTEEATEEIVRVIDAANVDLKGMSEAFYRELCGANLRPVLDSIHRLHKAGVWVEVTTLVIPGKNDGPDALRWTAEALVGISPSIPWHVTRFHPAYKLSNLPPTPVATLEAAQRMGREAGLEYVYVGNVPGEGEDTRCPACGALLIKRIGFLVRENRLSDGACPSCGREAAGVFSNPAA